ncbi:MAG: folate-binding protein [Proteobacteria bacterium]|nr:folate-binding protein [Pseudomonadota bacterium]
MTPRYVLLEDRGILTVGGADRAAFLQGLISNDIARVTDDAAIWAAYLTAQGKYLHDFFIVALDGGYGLDCESARLMDLGQRLSRHKLRAKVDLGIGLAFAVAALFGDGALAALDLPATPGAARNRDGGVVYVDPRLAQAGARAVLPVATAVTTLESLGFTAARPEDYDRMRLELGLSDGSRDMVVEKSILLECNFDELHGVDWEKGCYMGQELTARTKYRGLVKRRLVPVRLDGPAPATGTPIHAGAKDVGEMRSSRDGRGLAQLRLEVLSGMSGDAAMLRCGDATVIPLIPEWMRC